MGSFAVSVLGCFLTLTLVAADGIHNDDRHRSISSHQIASHQGSNKHGSIEPSKSDLKNIHQKKPPPSAITALANSVISGHLDQIGLSHGGSPPGFGGIHKTNAGSKHPLGFDLEGDILESLGIDLSKVSGDTGKQTNGKGIFAISSLLGAGDHHGVIQGDIEDLSALGEIISTKTYNRGLNGGIIKHTIIDGGFISEEDADAGDSAAVGAVTGIHGDINTIKGHQYHGGHAHSTGFNADYSSDQIKVPGLDEHLSSGNFIVTGKGVTHGLSGGKHGSRFTGHGLSSSKYEGGSSAGKFSSTGSEKNKNTKFGFDHSSSAGYDTSGAKFGSDFGAVHATGSKIKGSGFRVGHGSTVGGKAGGTAFVLGHGLSGLKNSGIRFGSGHGLSGIKHKNSGLGGNTDISSGKFSGFGSGHGLSSGNFNSKGFDFGLFGKGSFSTGPIGSSFTHSTNRGKAFTSGNIHTSSKLKGKGFSPILRPHGVKLGSSFTGGKLSQEAHSFSGGKGFSSDVSGDLSGGKFSSGRFSGGLSNDKFKNSYHTGVISGKLKGIKLDSSAGTSFKGQSSLSGLSHGLGFKTTPISSHSHGHNFKNVPTIVKGQGIRILGSKSHGYGNSHQSGVGSDYYDALSNDYGNVKFESFEANVDYDGNGNFNGFTRNFGSGDIEKSRYGGFSSFGDAGFKGFSSTFNSGRPVSFGRDIDGKFSDFSRDHAITGGKYSAFGRQHGNTGGKYNVFSREHRGHEFGGGFENTVTHLGSELDGGHDIDGSLTRSRVYSGRYPGSILVSHRPDNPYGSRDRKEHHG